MKIIKHQDPEYIKYDDAHWRNLKRLRAQAIPILQALQEHHLTGNVFGSVARGDVSETSDLDIFISEFVPSYKVDLALKMSNFQIIGKDISMATPSSIIKGTYYLGDEISISIRLTEFTSSPFQFYVFSGYVSLNEIMQEKRVPGVSKALLMIEPTKEGHKTYSLLGNEYEARKILNIEEKMLEERIRVLTKRDKYGRTGLFFKEDIHPEDSFEDKLQEFAAKNSLIRRRLSFK
jgi:predicted nucleotidyltransferase